MKKSDESFETVLLEDSHMTKSHESLAVWQNDGANENEHRNILCGQAIAFSISVHTHIKRNATCIQWPAGAEKYAKEHYKKKSLL